MNLKIDRYSIEPHILRIGTRGSYGVESLTLNFSAEWDGLTKTVSFYPAEGKAVAVVLNSDSCAVPQEMTAVAGKGKLMIRGVKDGVAILSLEATTIVEGTATPADTPAGSPTPTEMEQVLTYLGTAVDIAQSVRDDADNGVFDGKKGDTGNAATIEIGTVVSGDTPSVVNSGDKHDAVFDFTLPQGDAGFSPSATVEEKTDADGYAYAEFSVTDSKGNTSVEIPYGERITSGYIADNGHLYIVTNYNSNNPIDCGVAKGANGVSVSSVNVDNNNHLQVTLSDDTTIDAGVITNNEQNKTENALVKRVYAGTYDDVSPIISNFNIEIDGQEYEDSGTPTVPVNMGFHPTITVKSSAESETSQTVTLDTSLNKLLYSYTRENIDFTDTLIKEKIAVDRVNRKVYKYSAYKEFVFDGTEDWVINSGNASYYPRGYDFSGLFTNPRIDSYSTYLSTHFKGTNYDILASNDDAFALKSAMIYIHTSVADVDGARNKDAFKAWLVAQNTAGTPVKMLIAYSDTVSKEESQRHLHEVDITDTDDGQALLALYTYSPDMYIEDNCSAVYEYTQDINPVLKRVARKNKLGGILSIPISTLDGKNIVCFGDSITNLGYPDYIQSATGANVYNVGFSGMQMCQSANAAYTPFSMYKLADAITTGVWTEQNANIDNILSKNKEAHLATLKAIDFDEIDYITISFGTNDWDSNNSGGLDNENNDKDTTTYLGAARYSLEKIMTAFPNIKVALITPIYRAKETDGVVTDSDVNENPITHLKLTDYVDALSTVAKEFKIPCVDMYYELSINQYNRDNYFTRITGGAVDRVHPNDLGLEVMGRRVAGKLLSNF